MNNKGTNQMLISAGIFVENEVGEILAFRRQKNVSDNNVYGFVGGKVDPGETAIQAAIREAFEEAGVIVEINEDARNSCFMSFVDDTHTSIFILYKAHIVEGADNIGKHVRENEGAPVWIMPSEILNSPFCDYNQRALQHFLY
jgi:8-oxo-dGTP diphosphatase